MIEDKITVIIPIYNRASYLRDCLESIVNQSYKNLEIMLVDDGSTDASPEICEEYAKKDPRVVVVHQENQGRVAARNTGLLASTGEYITFVDSDDWVDLDMCQRFYDLMMTHQVDAVGGNLVYLKDDVGLQFKITTGLYTNQVEDENNIYDLFRISQLSYDPIQDESRQNLVTPLYTSIICKLFRKVHLMKPLLQCPSNMRYFEDIAQLYGVFSQISSYYQDDSYVAYYYRGHAENTMGTFELGDFIEYQVTNDYIKSFYPNPELYQIFVNYHKMSIKERFIGYCRQEGLSTGFGGLTNLHMNFSRLDQPKKIAIYAMGACGKQYYHDFIRYSKHEIVALVDKNLANTTYKNHTIQAPDILQKIFFDQIVIAVAKESAAQEIKQELIQTYAIEEEKIIWSKPIGLSDLMVSFTE